MTVAGSIRKRGFTCMVLACLKIREKYLLFYENGWFLHIILAISDRMGKRIFAVAVLDALKCITSLLIDHCIKVLLRD